MYCRCLLLDDLLAGFQMCLQIWFNQLGARMKQTTEVNLIMPQPSRFQSGREKTSQHFDPMQQAIQ